MPPPGTGMGEIAQFSWPRKVCMVTVWPTATPMADPKTTSLR